MSHLDYEINKELGECYLFMGELTKAEEYYHKAIGSNGVHAEPYLGLATIAVQRGDLDKAFEFYTKAGNVADNDKALTGMALVEMETGRNAEAFDHLQAALAINPENVMAIFGIIRLAHQLNRLEETLPCLENYLTLDPLKHEVRYCLAGCLLSLGRTPEARAQLAFILENDPGHAQARELLAQAAA